MLSERISEIVKYRDMKALDELIKITRDEIVPLSEKKQAIWAMGKLKNSAALPSLFHIILYQSNAELVEKASWALEEIGDPSATPVLKKVLSDPKFSDEAKFYAASALVSWGEKTENIETVLNSIDHKKIVEDNKDRALSNSTEPLVLNINNIKRIGKEKLIEYTDILIDILNNPSKSPEKKAAAAWALGNMKAEKAIKVLTTMINNSNIQIAAKSVWALGEIANTRTAVHLINLLKKVDIPAEIKWNAAIALSNMGFQSTVEPLLENIKTAAIKSADKLNGFDITIPSNPQYLKLVREKINEVCDRFSIPEEKAAQIIMAVDETIMNIIEHAHKFDENKTIQIKVLKRAFKENKLCFQFINQGKPFVIEKTDNLDLEKHKKIASRRGLGVYIIKQFMEDIKTELLSNGKILTTMWKTIYEE